MDILDIFSWLPEKEMSLEKIEEIVKDIYIGVSNEGQPNYCCYRLQIVLYENNIKVGLQGKLFKIAYRYK